MRRGFAAVLIAAVALSWITAFAGPSALPPCCKTHGCKMLKRGCAFASCDRSAGTNLVKQVRAILAERGGQPPTAVWTAEGRCRPPVKLSGTATTIDHPPPLVIG